MNKIHIYYWHSPLPGLKYRHGEDIVNTSRRLTNIIKKVTGAGYSLMIRPDKDSGNLIVYIDNGRFGQK